MVCRSACVSSTRRIRSPGFSFSVCKDMLSPPTGGFPTLDGRSQRTSRHASPKTTWRSAFFPQSAESCDKLQPAVVSAPRMVTFEDVVAARDRIRGHVERTPCPRSWNFSALCGAEIYFKLENLQRTGSFKERGAANKLMLLGPEERRRGVVASSAGNHAQGVAVNARRLGIRAVIVMPESTPLVKIQATREQGAEVVLCGTVFEDAYLEARRLEKEKGYLFVHAFDDDQIIAG